MERQEPDELDRYSCQRAGLMAYWKIRIKWIILTTVRAMVLWGHAPNSQTRMKEMKTAMEKLDMLVVVDPYPTVSAAMQDRSDGVYLAASFDTVRNTRFCNCFEPIISVAQ